LVAVAGINPCFAAGGIGFDGWVLDTVSDFGGGFPSCCLDRVNDFRRRVDLARFELELLKTGLLLTSPRKCIAGRQIAVARQAGISIANGFGDTQAFVPFDHALRAAE